MQKFKHIMRGTQGALIVASTLQIIIGFSGLWRNVTRFVVILIYFQIGSLMLIFYSMFSRYLSPLSAVPLVALAGFGLYEFGFPGVSFCFVIYFFFGVCL